MRCPWERSDGMEGLRAAYSIHYNRDRRAMASSPCYNIWMEDLGWLRRSCHSSLRGQAEWKLPYLFRFWEFLRNARLLLVNQLSINKIRLIVRRAQAPYISCVLCVTSVSSFQFSRMINSKSNSFDPCPIWRMRHRHGCRLKIERIMRSWTFGSG
jgi:hypothetical protein